MKTKEAINIVNALNTIAEALDDTLMQVASRIVFYNDTHEKIIIEAITEYQKFSAAPLKERGEMLGLKITTHSVEREL